MSYSKNVIYKSHRVKDLYCTTCEEFLSGDGSYIRPYKCNCGTYEYNYKTSQYEINEALERED